LTWQARPRRKDCSKAIDWLFAVFDRGGRIHKFTKCDNTFWKAVNFAQTQSSTSSQPALAMFSLAVVKFRTWRLYKRAVDMVRTINQFT
jgi:hypothetical protein